MNEAFAVLRHSVEKHTEESQKQCSVQHKHNKRKCNKKADTAKKKKDVNFSVLLQSFQINHDD
jgi:hypothetical protein